MSYVKICSKKSTTILIGPDPEIPRWEWFEDFSKIYTASFCISDIPNKGIGVAGAGRRSLDVNVHQFTVATKNSLHLLVRDVQLQVA